MVVSFLAYGLGGYIAGRMAGQAGGINGLMVAAIGFVLGIVLGTIVGVVIAATGSSFAQPDPSSVNVGAVLAVAGVSLVLTFIGASAATLAARSVRVHRPQCSGLLEDYRPAAVYQDAVSEVPTHGAGQNAAFYLPALTNQVVHGLAVGNVGDVLVDYRSGVEVFCDVVGRRADGLYAPLVRPAVRVGPDEGRQE